MVSFSFSELSFFYGVWRFLKKSVFVLFRIHTYTRAKRERERERRTDTTTTQGRTCLASAHHVGSGGIVFVI